MTRPASDRYTGSIGGGHHGGPVNVPTRLPPRWSRIGDRPECPGNSAWVLP